MDDTPMVEEEEQSTPLPTSETFIPPSIALYREQLLRGETYTHFSPIPTSILPTPPANNAANAETAAAAASEASSRPAVTLGVDEAGRGPVLGPMVYAAFFLPSELSTPLLKTTHHFDDSKVLTAAVRASLMHKLCTPDTDLHSSSGWCISALSARDISSNMMRPSTSAAYNLNAQAMDATVGLIRGVLDRGVNVREIYIDTIGRPETYQAKLEKLFPGISITVAKKADSLYPVVSAASVVAKVTRDVALGVLWENEVLMDVDEGRGGEETEKQATESEPEWGSGYPSDARCTSWLKRNMHPVFGWGPECRFSWGTAKDMLEAKGMAAGVEWPAGDDDEGNFRVSDYFSAKEDDDELDGDELRGWFGTSVGTEVF
ncbi:ribonuclease H-like domain-containing protein [Xylogone sp. PMI_703]|nr:ribonuclease H-like domain-containing protein [Xylogone sp. PMI_703]